MGTHRPRRRAGAGRQGLIGLSDQLPLIGPRGGLKPRPTRAPTAVSGSRRVAVLVDTRLPHLARTFTYLVPDQMAAKVAPGVRVRVRLAGQLVEGFVLPDEPDPSFDGPVMPLDSVVSAVPVLTPAILRLAREVARHYAGSVSDVLRLAIPPRQAGPEAGWGPADPAPPDSEPERPGGLAGHPFIDAAGSGEVIRACWAAPAGSDWSRQLASAAVAVATAGRGALVIVPDGKDLVAVATAARLLAGDTVAVLRGDDPPRERYTQFLAVLAGRARVVIGTRAAIFAPVRNLGLIATWDDGDPSLAEQRAPYPHAREVAALRSHTEPCALLLAGVARSPEVQRWVEVGWVAPIDDGDALRRRRPHAFATSDRIRSPFDLTRRLPQSAVAALRTGLASGPVLVHTARTGYVPMTACQNCREIAECPRCDGPLSLAVDGVVTCRRCDAREPFHCPHCGHQRLRAVRVGAARTAEELGRMFPGVAVVQSTGEHPVATVSAAPAVVVATPGVEPVAEGGYAAGAILDAQEGLWRVGMRAREDTIRHWFNAAVLLRPEAPLAITADSTDPAVQALIRWDPAMAATAELRRREASALPPIRQVAMVDGDVGELERIVAQLGDDVEVLGPRVLTESASRVLLRATDFPGLRDRLRQLVVAGAAAHTRTPIRVQIDPISLD